MLWRLTVLWRHSNIIIVLVEIRSMIVSSITIIIAIEFISLILLKAVVLWRIKRIIRVVVVISIIIMRSVSIHII